MRAVDVETSPQNWASWSQIICTDSARYRVGELYFLHFADVWVFTQPGSHSENLWLSILGLLRPPRADRERTCRIGRWGPN